MCFVLDANYQRTNCVGCEFLSSCCPECAVCASCYAGHHPANGTTALRYSFTVDSTLITRAEAQNGMLQIVFLVLVLLMFVFIFRRVANRISHALAHPVKSLAEDMERVSHMHFGPTKKATASLYEIAKIENSFAVMKGTLQVDSGRQILVLVSIESTPS